MNERATEDPEAKSAEEATPEIPLETMGEVQSSEVRESAPRGVVARSNI